MKKAKSLLDGALEMAHSVSVAIPGGNFELDIKDINDQIEPVRRVIKSVLIVLDVLENLAAQVQSKEQAPNPSPKRN